MSNGIADLWERIRDRADNPDWKDVTLSMAPITGELSDLVEVGAGLQDRSPGRVGLGIAALALPFVGAAGLKKIFKGKTKRMKRYARSQKRAKKMGFDLDVYHASPHEVKGPFRRSPHPYNIADQSIGSGVYVSPSPKFVEQFATDDWRHSRLGRGSSDPGPTYPLRVRSKKLLSSDSPEFKELVDDVIHNDPYFNPSTPRTDPYFKPGGWGHSEAQERARKLAAEMGWEGFYRPKKAWTVDPITKKGHWATKSPHPKDADEIVIFDPKNIRSRFAEFDPKKRHVADIMAGIAGLSGARYVSNALREDRENNGI